MVKKSGKARDAKSVRKQSIISLGGGLVLVVIGIAASIGSYNMAKPGQTYSIYYGPVVLGVVFAARGLFGLINPNFFVKRAKEEAVLDDHAVEDDTPEKKGNEKIEF